MLGTLVFLAVSGLFAKNLYIPVAGVARGANNTLFRTDVRIFNPSATQDLAVSLHFLPIGQDGSNYPGTIVTVGKRQMLVLDNIAENFFHLPSGSIGAIRLDSDDAVSHAFSADSRTYTDSPNPAVPGTYGQYIPALDSTRGIAKSIVLHVSSSSDLSKGFRTNAGIMNPNSTASTVTPRLHRADGTLVAQGAPLTILPKSMTQQSLSSLFGPVTDFEDGFILFDSSLPVFTWASVIDNRSADPIFVLGVEDKDEITPL
jgi:hypothetical protein